MRCFLSKSVFFFFLMVMLISGSAFSDVSNDASNDAPNKEFSVGNHWTVKFVDGDILLSWNILTTPISAGPLLPPINYVITQVHGNLRLTPTQETDQFFLNYRRAAPHIELRVSRDEEISEAGAIQEHRISELNTYVSGDSASEEAAREAAADYSVLNVLTPEIMAQLESDITGATTGAFESARRFRFPLNVDGIVRLDEDRISGYRLTTTEGNFNIQHIDEESELEGATYDSDSLGYIEWNRLSPELLRQEQLSRRYFPMRWGGKAYDSFGAFLGWSLSKLSLSKKSSDSSGASQTGGNLPSKQSDDHLAVSDVPDGSALLAILVLSVALESGSK